MINTLDDYVSCSILENSPFITNPNLAKKVDKNGIYLEFIGNTVVFLLNEAVKQELSVLQDHLYENAEAVLSQRLIPDTFHMTLHDLVNGPGSDLGLRARMESIASPVKQIISKWKDQAPLHMRTTWMFNMVNTSIVLGLAPADEDTYERLDGMYCRLEEELRLGYALCPHITLAYFKPGVYAPEQIEKLRHALHAVDMKIDLQMNDLVLQRFTDMNHYESVK